MPVADLAVQKVIVIYSPRSGRSEQLARALTTFQKLGIEVADVIPIASLDHLPPQGAHWQSLGIDCAVAAGGDGLLGGVVAHVAQSGLPLGILPLGTSNDVARTVNIPMDIERAATIISLGKSQLIDVGIAQPAEQEPLPNSSSNDMSAESTIPASQKMYFAHALTVGLNVQFARLATQTQVRQRYGAFTYPYAVYEALRNYEHIEAVLEFEGLLSQADKTSSSAFIHEPALLHCHTAQVTVVNAPVFWGQWQARVPGVSIYDRVLDIVIIEDGMLEELLSRITRFFKRESSTSPDKHAKHAQYPQLLPAELTDIPGVHHVQARGVKITTLQSVQAATLDGELRGRTPLHVQIALEQLHLIVPPQHT
jgi:diacylglycerol kinase (ATP)